MRSRGASENDGERGGDDHWSKVESGVLHKGSDLSLLAEDDLDAIARSLNDRPRKTRVGFMKPSERLSELVARTG